MKASQARISQGREPHPAAEVRVPQRAPARAREQQAVIFSADESREVPGKIRHDEIAVELGDAGQAIELAQQVDPGNLSPERQARYYLDLAQAHTMRRQIGEALHALQEAERIAPEETRVHYVGRAVTRDLLQLSGLRPRPELRELAERFGVLP
jgi:Flp pilus assembly protein TadD